MRSVWRGDHLGDRGNPPTDWATDRDIGSYPSLQKVERGQGLTLWEIWGIILQKEKLIEKVKLNGSQALVGPIVFEQLDLVVEPSTTKVIPNARSPEMPMVEILSTCPFKSDAVFS